MREHLPSPGPRLRSTVLRPGVHVLRRSAAELQVGLDPRRAIVLPDRPQVRALLDALSVPGAVPAEKYDADALGLLDQSGLLVDADTLLPLVPHRPAADTDVGTDSRPRPERSVVAALASETGDRATEVLAARAGGVVEVASCGDAGAGRLGDRIAGLLEAAGARTRRREHGAAPVDPDLPAVGLLAVVGEPPRERLDGWTRAGTPHLVLRLSEGHAALGPFVLPGRTACLRCVDAHHTDVDRAWPLLVAQYAEACARARPDTVPEPVDPLLAELVSAWAAREVVTYLEGRRPATCSATLRLDPHLTSLESHAWPRHPGCGCAWDD